MELADATEYYETSFTVSKTASTQYYDLSSTSVYSAAATNPVLTVRRVFNVETNTWLSFIDVRDMDLERRQWEDNTGEATRFLIRGLWWLGLYPKPSATSGTVTVFASTLPTALSADASTTGLPQEYDLALVEYACYDLLCQDGEFGKAMRYYGKYLQKQEGLRKFVLQRSVKDRVGALG